MRAPRILLSAPASGSGKTLITCGILQALLNRNLRLSAFKCGPDYIDPMFHGRVLGIPSKNLDTFFTGEEMTRYLFCKEALKTDLSVLEGVMGFYDGVAGKDTQASAYDLARVTRTPVILIADTKGMSVSVTALVKGFLEYRKDSRVAGVILNRMSAGLYPRIKEQLETELSIKVLGYVPYIADCVIESRHLGLITPDEVSNLQEKLQELAKVMEKTLDFEEILALANQAEELSCEKPDLPRLPEGTVKIGVARDEAFCFYYRDNLELLEEMGAELCYFSPLHDGHLPEGLEGLIFYGGYPELYAKGLSSNETMRAEIREALKYRPFLAECGGFLYLQETLEDMEGNTWPMAGVLKGRGYRTGKLGRFGYLTLELQRPQMLGGPGEQIRGHEFHYFDSTNNGTDVRGRKPLTSREWECMQGSARYLAGFPHLYYYSNPTMAFRFLEKCKESPDLPENREKRFQTKK